jgi:hypothetical protein
LLCLFKAYEETKEKYFGGLISPSDTFLDHVLGLEAKFVMELENNVSKLEIGKYLLSKLPTFSLLGCPSFPSLLFFSVMVFLFNKILNKTYKPKNSKHLERHGRFDEFDLWASRSFNFKIK